MAVRLALLGAPLPRGLGRGAPGPRRTPPAGWRPGGPPAGPGADGDDRGLDAVRGASTTTSTRRAPSRALDELAAAGVPVAAGAALLGVVCRPGAARPARGPRAATAVTSGHGAGPHPVPSARRPRRAAPLHHDRLTRACRGPGAPRGPSQSPTGAACALCPAVTGRSTRPTTTRRDDEGRSRMPATLTVRLPDGSTKELADGATALDLAASIGPRLAKDAVAAGRRGPVGRPVGRPCPTAPRWPSSPTASDAGRQVLRHSTAHVLAQAVLRLWPGAHYAIGPVDRRRLLLRLRAARRRPFQRRRPRADRGGMREIMAEDQPFVREEHTDRRRGWPCSRTSPSSARSSRPSARGAEEVDAVAGSDGGPDGAAGRVDLLERRRPSSTCAGDPTCRRPSRLGPLQAPAGGRCLLARRREAAPAPADLRHGLGVREGAGRAPAPARGGRAARPPPARRRARPLLLPPRDRLGPGRLPSQGRDHPPSHGGLLAPAPRGQRLRVRLLAPHHQVRPVRDLRAPRLVRRGHVPADGARRGHGLLPQAHELPVPHPDLPEPPAVVPRAAPAAVRVRHGLPLREVRCRARAHPRAGHDPGRRPHLLHPRADGRRARLAPHVRARPATRLRARRLLPRAVHQARGQGGRQRRASGTRPPRPCARWPGPGTCRS